MTTKPKRCSLCRCFLTETESSRGSRCEACRDSYDDPEQRGICEDREPGGHDTVSQMRLMRNGDPMHLANCLQWMGITENGDDVEHDPEA